MKGIIKLMVGLGVLATVQVTALNSLKPTYNKLENQAYKIVEQSNDYSAQVQQALDDLEGKEVSEGDRIDY